jgi:hypothetical protein
MKTVKLNELEKEALLTQKEPIAIEYNSKIIGYYKPVIDSQTAKKAKEELDI